MPLTTTREGRSLAELFDRSGDTLRRLREAMAAGPLDAPSRTGREITDSSDDPSYPIPPVSPRPGVRPCPVMWTLARLDRLVLEKRQR